MGNNRKLIYKRVTKLKSTPDGQLKSVDMPIYPCRMVKPFSLLILPSPIFSS